MRKPTILQNKAIKMSILSFTTFMLTHFSYASIAPKSLLVKKTNNIGYQAFENGKEWCEAQGQEKTCIPFNNASDIDLRFYVTIPHDDYNQNAIVESGVTTGLMVPSRYPAPGPVIKYINVRVENTNNKKIIFNGIAKNFVGITCQKLAKSIYSCKQWGI